MDPNLISALSIARRVLDPLGELIKVSCIFDLLYNKPNQLPPLSTGSS